MFYIFSQNIGFLIFYVTLKIYPDPKIDIYIYIYMNMARKGFPVTQYE